MSKVRRLRDDAVQLADAVRSVDLAALHALISRGGRCRGEDPARFFPEDAHDAQDPVELCRRCGVRSACLVFALASREEHGVWGGRTEYERAELLDQVDAVLAREEAA
ncbi:MAG: WhiB family transcriptional regulator [Micromonosporaceae bacterium]